MKALLTVGLSVEAIESLRDLLAREEWEVLSAAGWMQVFLRLRERSYHAVVCEASLPDGDWRDALDELWVCTNPPPFIVTSRLADSHLWAEVLAAGGYDVAPYPIEAGELRRVLEQAGSRKRARGASSPHALVPAAGFYKRAS